MLNGFKAPDGRGWVALACFVLVILLLVMIWVDPSLMDNDFFKTIATLLIGTAWVNGPVGWAFQATKQGGELANRNADIVENAATSPTPTK